MSISLWDYLSLGRPQWRGQTSMLKAACFLIFGTLDMHTRLRNSYVLNQIKQLGLPPQSRVLEGGCGRAVTLFWLARHHPDWQLTGVELDPALAKSARHAAERGHFTNITITEGDILELDEKQAYDLIVSIDVLEHVQDDVGLLRRFWQALKPGGYLVLHVPRRHQQMWRWLPIFHKHGVVGYVREEGTAGECRQVVIEGHVRDEYTPEELYHVVEEGGFRVVDLRETIGHYGEIAFELNNLLWQQPLLRYLFALLTYPIAASVGYLDIRQNPSKGNSLLITATRD